VERGRWKTTKSQVRRRINRNFPLWRIGVRKFACRSPVSVPCKFPQPSKSRFLGRQRAGVRAASGKSRSIEICSIRISARPGEELRACPAVMVTSVAGLVIVPVGRNSLARESLHKLRHRRYACRIHKKSSNNREARCCYSAARSHSRHAAALAVKVAPTMRCSMSKACVGAPGRMNTTEEIFAASGVWHLKYAPYPMVLEETPPDRRPARGVPFSREKIRGRVDFVCASYCRAPDCLRLKQHGGIRKQQRVGVIQPRKRIPAGGAKRVVNRVVQTAFKTRRGSVFIIQRPATANTFPLEEISHSFRYAAANAWAKRPFGRRCGKDQSAPSCLWKDFRLPKSSRPVCSYSQDVRGSSTEVP